MPRWLDRLAVVGVSLATYLLMARAECRGDGAQYLYNYLLGYSHGGRHYLVYVALGWADSLSHLLGTSLHDAAVMVCAVATALGLGFVHAAFLRLGCDRKGGFLYALAVGACPGVMLYATVYELHGLFFAFVGLAFYGMSWYVQRPSARTACLMGCCAGLSYLAHATGALLVGVVPWLAVGAVADREADGLQRLRSQLPRAGLAVAVGAATIVASLGGLAVLGSKTSLGSALGFAEEWMAGQAQGFERPAADAVGTVWYEWLLPFFPASALWLLALRDRSARCSVLAFAVCLAGYLALSLAMLRGLVEYGAYVLPMAVPAVWLVRRAAPHAALALLLIVTGTLALRWGMPPARSAEMARVGAAIAALADDRTVFLIGNAGDLEPFLLHAPEAVWVPLQRLAAGRDPTAARIDGDNLAQGIADFLSDGRRVVLTGRGRMLLEGQLLPEVNPSAGIVREAIEKRFALEPFEPSSPFTCYRFVPR